MVRESRKHKPNLESLKKSIQSWISSHNKMYIPSTYGSNDLEFCDLQSFASCSSLGTSTATSSSMSSRQSSSETPQHLRNFSLDECEYDCSKYRFILSKCIFRKFIASIVNVSFEEYQIEPKALDLLQKASEEYLVRYFRNINRCAQHAKRITVMIEDVELINWIEKMLKELPLNV